MKGYKMSCECLRTNQQSPMMEALKDIQASGPGTAMVYGVGGTPNFTLSMCRGDSSQNEEGLHPVESLDSQQSQQG